MNNNTEDLSSFGSGHWKVQPSWMKALTVIVGLPAWLALVVSAYKGGEDGTVFMVAFAAFSAVALLQLAFVFRAYWRMDL